MTDDNFYPVPKPVDKKKKKLENGYIDKPNRYCFYTGEPGAERHEIFGGANRENSIRYKFQLDLCHRVHAHFTDPTTEADMERIRFWKQHFQMKFEHDLMMQGMPAASARTMWEMLIGENFLKEVKDYVQER